MHSAPVQRKQPNRRYPLAGLSLDVALAAPVAELALQPAAVAVDAARETTGKVKLASRIVSPVFFAHVML
jgi:hypothetical protein